LSILSNEKYDWDFGNVKVSGTNDEDDPLAVPVLSLHLYKLLKVRNTAT
jgi:hypothetical protein